MFIDIVVVYLTLKLTQIVTYKTDRKIIKKSRYLVYTEIDLFLNCL